MKLSTKSLACLAIVPALVSAHDVLNNARHVQHARQAPAGTTAPPAATAPAPAPTYSTFPSIAVPLASTNPTAVPLNSIVAGAPPAPTVALATTFPAGSVPSSIPGAPGLPVINIVPANYPPLDRIPPTNSPEVLQWIQEVKNSGITIPSLSATVEGGCPANAQAAADASRCWWTCSGCTRDTDVAVCPDKLTWGLTYDDGPSTYTPNLVNYLNEVKVQGTFFVVGSRVISNPVTLQTQYMTGHQIAIHTWSHHALTTLTNDQIIAELGWSKKAIKDVLGVTPNQMRPPFGDIDDRVRAIATAMGLTPVMWTRLNEAVTFDTDDFDINGGFTGVTQVLHNWQNILGNVSSLNTGFIVLEHDLFQQAVDIATGYIMPDALAHNPAFAIKPVIACLNKPPKDAYIETNDNSTNPPPALGGKPTLSSGAPGSAQSTGKTNSTAGGGSSTGAATSMGDFSTGFGVTAAALLGLASLFAML